MINLRISTIGFFPLDASLLIPPGRAMFTSTFLLSTILLGHVKASQAESFVLLETLD